VILLKNDEVIDFFNMPAYWFYSITNSKAKMQFNFQKPVTTLLPMKWQWRFDKE